MPFEKERYNPTTEYYEAKKVKKISSEPGKFIQYPLLFKQWLVARAKNEGIRPAFRSAGVLHNNYYMWKRLLTHAEEFELQKMADQDPWGTCRNFGLEFGVLKSTAWHTLIIHNKDRFVYKKPNSSCSESNLERIFDI
jgi:hypothetical protein